MSAFRFYHPIEVRYGDLDPQGHVNNAKFLTYFEQGRVSYVRHLGLWNGMDFTEIGFILADAHVTYLAPVTFGQELWVGVRTTRLGNKSLTLEYSLEERKTKQVLATGTTIVVAYDYHNHQTIPVPEVWRSTIADFEGLERS